MKATRDLGFADPFAIKLPHLATLPRRRWRPSQALPVLSGMTETDGLRPGGIHHTLPGIQADASLWNRLAIVPGHPR